MPKTIDPNDGSGGKPPVTQSGSRKRKRTDDQDGRVSGRRVSAKGERAQALEELDKTLQTTLKQVGIVFGELHMINASKCKSCHGGVEARRQALSDGVDAMDDDGDTAMVDDDDDAAVASSSSSSAEPSAAKRQRVESESRREVIKGLSKGAQENLKSVAALHKLMHMIYKGVCKDCQQKLDDRAAWYQFTMMV